MLEDELRAMLTAKAAQAPLPHDVAGEAVRRGRIARRRRMTAGSTAAAFLLVLTLSAAVFLQSRLPSARGAIPVGPGRPTVTITPTTTTAPAPRAVPDTGVAADLVAGDQLWTAEGQLLSLSGVGAITRAYRVPVGWVYGGAEQVRLMRPDGSSVALSGRGESWILSPDGTAIAFVVDRTLHVGHVGTAGLAVNTSIEMAVDAAPVAFVGKRVLVARTAAAGGADRHHELLDPAKPGAVWDAELAAVYGTLGAETIALARTGGGLCLVAVRSGDGTIARRGGCDLALSADAVAVAAPDGARLAVRSGGRLRVLDVAEALRGRAGVVASCPLDGDGPVTWADRSTVLAGTAGSVLRCTVDGARGAVRLPAEIGTSWLFAALPTAR